MQASTASLAYDSSVREARTAPRWAWRQSARQAVPLVCVDHSPTSVHVLEVHCLEDRAHLMHYASTGYFCPNGTGVLTSSLACSSSLRYCPDGSSSPLNTSVGFFAVMVSPSAPGVPVYGNQSVCEMGHYCIDGVSMPCPAGKYGNITGLSSAACSGDCDGGYYCPAGSSSATQEECGDESLFCPQVSPHTGCVWRR